jgi:glycosyltransferase involved in cell wall biosynthesis
MAGNKTASRKKTVFISNSPAPYREKIYELMSRELPGHFTLIFCMRREPDRSWDHMKGEYPQIFLKERVFSYHNKFERFVHYNPDVWKWLNELNPDIVVTNGYNPTHLIAFLWTVVKRRRHVVFYDGWLGFDRSLTFIHKFLRKFVIRNSAAFIGASRQTEVFFRHYGAPREKIFFSHLCADNARFFDHSIGQEKQYDLMFSGRMMDIKMPLFFCDVARHLQEMIGSVSVLMLGDGPLKQEVHNRLESWNIRHELPGFINQQVLPEYYHRSRLFLFPTQIDCWGVVANEACAAGLPVITCDNTAVAGELVLHDENGYVLPLDPRIWAEHCYKLIRDEVKYKQFSERSVRIVKEYNYENAAAGFAQAIHSLS